MSNDNIVDEIEESIAQEERNILKLRTSIVGAMNKKVLVDELRTIVNESKYFSFSSDRAARFISTTRPQLDLLFDIPLAAKDHPKLDLYYVDNYTVDTEQVNRDRASVINDKIVLNISNLVLAAVYYVIDEIPVFLKPYTEKVKELFGGHTIEELRKSIIDIIPKVKGDTVIYNFIVGNISAITFSKPTEDDADSFLLELIL